MKNLMLKELLEIQKSYSENNIQIGLEETIYADK